MNFLTEVTLSSAEHIYEDFDRARVLYPFWKNYPPQQRGRAPRGTSTPWGEVGEKVVGLSLTRAIAEQAPDIRYPGLPLGGDIRFSTRDAIIHFDIKSTGPNNNANEIVASPHQISGDGKEWLNNGIKNSPVTIKGRRSTMNFQPELPPFYYEADVLLCLTYFVKVVYKVQEIGYQPLEYLEIVCVPNGLFMFDGPDWNASVRELLIPGKDDAAVTKKRTRVRLNPLASIANWRCKK
ncbi:MAG: BglI family type II restriction endonuclease [Chloroflexaceae bacterium]|nr:BglI family type II restriction endonuclease [Chloroflexaceae bacterium]